MTSSASSAAWLRCGLLLLCCLATMVLSLMLGHLPLAPSDLVSGLLGTGSPAATAVVQELRGPRVLLGALVGASLGVAGVMVQALVRNPLADPSLLGIEHGAGLGVLLLVLLAPELAASAWALPLASIVGAVLALLFLLALATRRRNVDPLQLVLVGVGVNLLLGAAMTLLALAIPERLYESLLVWFTGTLTSADSARVLAVGLALFTAIPWAVRLAPAMDLGALGEDVPRALGLSLSRFRLQLAACSVVLAGSAWAAAGGIAFVGLLAPHLGRRLVGARHAALLPAAALVGALLVVVADLVGRTCVPPTEAPAGIVVALIGGPAFALMLVRWRRAAR
ncbi:MAG: iron ABC transporter permease [Myxococcales bacterium]